MNIGSKFPFPEIIGTGRGQGLKQFFSKKEPANYQ